MDIIKFKEFIANKHILDLHDGERAVIGVPFYMLHKLVEIIGSDYLESGYEVELYNDYITIDLTNILIDIVPKYVALNGIALRLNGDSYFHHAGAWGVGYKFIDGNLMTHSTEHKHIHEKPLVEITEEEWRINNSGVLIIK